MQSIRWPAAVVAVLTVVPPLLAEPGRPGEAAPDPLIRPEVAQAEVEPDTEPSQDAVLTLSLIDLGSLPEGTLAAVRGLLADCFGARGIVIAWARDPLDEQALARIVLTPSDPMALGLDGDVMAISVGMSQGRPTAYVFLRVVAHLVGERFVTGAWLDGVGRWRFTRALIRVVAHETIHALLPRMGHATHGLMAVEQGARELWIAPPVLEPAMADALLARLRHVPRAGPSRKLRPDQ